MPTPRGRGHVVHGAVIIIKDAGVAAQGEYCTVAYHDGGYTPANTKPNQPDEEAGWGYQLQRIPLSNLPGGADLPPATLRELGYGPIVLDVTEPSFCGAIARSNNTAELSALPHILVRILIRRRQRMAQASREHGCLNPAADFANPTGHIPLETVILAHDSQYVKDTCEVQAGTAPAATNTTLVSLCRRLLQEARDCGLKVVWVKVRGHSAAANNDADIPPASRATVDGNNWADKAAEYGATREPKEEKDIQNYIYYHLHRHVDVEAWQSRRDESTRAT